MIVRVEVTFERLRRSRPVLRAQLLQIRRLITNEPYVMFWLLRLNTSLTASRRSSSYDLLHSSSSYMTIFYILSHMLSERVAFGEDSAIYSRDLLRNFPKFSEPEFEVASGVRMAGPNLTMVTGNKSS